MGGALGREFCNVPRSVAGTGTRIIMILRERKIPATGDRQPWLALKFTQETMASHGRMKKTRHPNMNRHSRLGTERRPPGRLPDVVQEFTNRPATEKQKNKIISLGRVPPDNLTEEKANDLIDEINQEIWGRWNEGRNG